MGDFLQIHWPTILIAVMVFGYLLRIESKITRLDVITRLIVNALAHQSPTKSYMTANLPPPQKGLIETLSKLFRRGKI